MLSLCMNIGFSKTCICKSGAVRQSNRRKFRINNKDYFFTYLKIAHTTKILLKCKHLLTP